MQSQALESRADVEVENGPFRMLFIIRPEKAQIGDIMTDEINPLPQLDPESLFHKQVFSGVRPLQARKVPAQEIEKGRAGGALKVKSQQGKAQVPNERQTVFGGEGGGAFRGVFL